jgi:hypothetical protein
MDRLPASSRCPILWRFVQKDGCSSATAPTTASRSSTRTASFSTNGRNSACPLESHNSESTDKAGHAHNTGGKRGMRVGSAKDGKVTAFIPDPSPGTAITSRGRRGSGLARQCLWSGSRAQGREEVRQEVAGTQVRRPVPRHCAPAMTFGTLCCRRSALNPATSFSSSSFRRCR